MILPPKQAGGNGKFAGGYYLPVCMHAVSMSISYKLTYTACYRAWHTNISRVGRNVKALKLEARRYFCPSRAGLNLKRGISILRQIHGNRLRVQHDADIFIPFSLIHNTNRKGAVLYRNGMLCVSCLTADYPAHSVAGRRKAYIRGFRLCGALLLFRKSQKACFYAD